MSEETTEHTHEDVVEAETTPTFTTAFAVLMTKDGGIFIERNTSVLNFPVEREASLVEVRRACSDVLMDLQAQTSAEYTIIRLKALEDSTVDKPE
jgi:hypothetical protein